MHIAVAFFFCFCVPLRVPLESKITRSRLSSAEGSHCFADCLFLVVSLSCISRLFSGSPPASLEYFPHHRVPGFPCIIPPGLFASSLFCRLSITSTSGPGSPAFKTAYANAANIISNHYSPPLLGLPESGTLGRSLEANWTEHVVRSGPAVRSCDSPCAEYLNSAPFVQCPMPGCCSQQRPACSRQLDV